MWRWMRIEDRELFHRNDRYLKRFKVLYKLIGQLRALTKNMGAAYVLCKEHSSLAIGKQQSIVTKFVFLLNVKMDRTGGEID